MNADTAEGYQSGGYRRREAVFGRFENAGGYLKNAVNNAGDAVAYRKSAGKGEYSAYKGGEGAHCNGRRRRGGNGVYKGDVKRYGIRAFF